MGLFDFLSGGDINSGAQEWKNTPGAVLLDVRAPEEYRQGHLPGSVNLPLDELRRAGDRLPDRETPLFVYCWGGSRSSRAVRALKQMGYTRVKNIGGISRYKGRVEK